MHVKFAALVSISLCLSWSCYAGPNDPIAKRNAATLQEVTENGLRNAKEILKAYGISAHDVDKLTTLEQCQEKLEQLKNKAQNNIGNAHEKLNQDYQKVLDLIQQQQNRSAGGLSSDDATFQVTEQQVKVGLVVLGGIFCIWYFFPRSKNNNDTTDKQKK